MKYINYKLRIPLVSAKSKNLIIGPHSKYNTKPNHRKTNTTLHNKECLLHTQSMHNEKKKTPRTRSVKKIRKNTHDLLIEKQMRAFKQEIEHKYNKSKVNRYYKFPKRNSDIILINTYHDNNLLVSIYEPIHSESYKSETSKNKLTQSPNFASKIRRRFHDIIEKRKEEPFYAMKHRIRGNQLYKEENSLDKLSKPKLYPLRRKEHSNSKFNHLTKLNFKQQAILIRKVNENKVGNRNELRIIADEANRTKKLNTRNLSEYFTNELQKKTKRDLMNTHKSNGTLYKSSKRN